MILPPSLRPYSRGASTLELYQATGSLQTAIFKKGEKYKLATIAQSPWLVFLARFRNISSLATSWSKHLDAFQILTNFQHGFRARRSCETQLLTLTHELVTSFHYGRQTDMIILDFSKEFDRVPHQRLLRNLTSTLWHNQYYIQLDQSVSVRQSTTSHRKGLNVWQCPSNQRGIPKNSARTLTISVV